jgi:hypothetical protein
MKKYLLVLLLLACPTIIAYFAVPKDPPSTPGVTLENFRQLRIGMPAIDIHRILGSEGEVCFGRRPSDISQLIYRWQGTKCTIVVVCLAGALVCADYQGEHIEIISNEPRSILDKVRCFLGIAIPSRTTIIRIQ